MTYNREIHHRRSIRLKDHDYSSSGAYFVTICTAQRECLLGSIMEEEVHLSGAGSIAVACWNEIASHFSHVALDAFVAMPNHVHGILVIKADVGARSPRPGAFASEAPGTGPSPPAPPGAETAPLQVPGLGRMIAYFKYQSAKQINVTRGTPGAPVWQRNYYDHVLRNETDLNATRQYIADNPARWADDPDNPTAVAR
jgi:REP-associated tyrosine transposase